MCWNTLANFVLNNLRKWCWFLPCVLYHWDTNRTLRWPSWDRFVLRAVSTNMAACSSECWSFQNGIRDDLDDSWFPIFLADLAFCRIFLCTLSPLDFCCWRPPKGQTWNQPGWPQLHGLAGVRDPKMTMWKPFAMWPGLNPPTSDCWIWQSLVPPWFLRMLRVMEPPCDSAASSKKKMVSNSSFTSHLAQKSFWTNHSAKSVMSFGHCRNFLWGIQMLLGSMCPVNLAAEGHVAEFQGELCTANQVNNDPNHEKCPAYRDAACGPDATHHWCQDWECANSIPCLLVPTGKTLLKANLTGATKPKVSVAANVTSFQAGKLITIRLYIWSTVGL